MIDREPDEEQMVVFDDDLDRVSQIFVTKDGECIGFESIYENSIILRRSRIEMLVCYLNEWLETGKLNNLTLPS